MLIRKLFHEQNVEQLKKLDGNRNATNACNNQSIFVLAILEKMKATRLKIFSKEFNSVINDTLRKGSVKLTNSQLSKLKSVPKNETEITLRTTKQNFQDEKLPHKFFPATRENTKTKNAVLNNMSTVIKLSCLKQINQVNFV